MTPKDFAARIAGRYCNPGDRPRTHPPSVTIEERAEETFWQAEHKLGFTGGLVAWTALIRDALTSDVPAPVKVKPTKIEPKTELALPKSEASKIETPPDAPSTPAEDLAPVVQKNPFANLYGTDL